MAEESYASENIRSFPSSMPIRSPSPDTKASNKLNRTISPNIQIRNQQQTSPSSMHNSRRVNEEYESIRMENNELREQLNLLQIGGGTFSNDEISRLRHRIKEQDRMIWSYKKDTENATEQGNSFLRETRLETTDDLRQKLQEKERIINQLKKILTNMPDASPIHHLSHYGSAIDQEYRENINILELENQKLSDMVKKLNRKNGNDKMVQENRLLSNRVEQLLIENNELQQRIERFKRSETEEITELNKVNNVLTNQIKILGSIEEKNRNLERQNERLMRMLKDSKQSQKGMNANRNLEEQIAKLQYQNRNIKERTSAPEKMTIAKIKEQHNENLKMFKQTVYEEVSREFEKFQMTIKMLHSKLDQLEQRTSRILHTEEDMSSPPLERDQSPVVNKVSQSPQPFDFESPGNRQTKKKAATNERFFEQTQTVEVNSQVDEDPVISRLEAQLQTQQKQKSELSQKYNQLTADYNNLNQAHVNSLNDIQKYMNEIKRLKDSIDQSKADIQKIQSRVEEVTQNKINIQKQHIEEVTRVRQSSMTEADRIRLNYEEKLEQLKSMTEDQINRLNDTYNQQIVVLRQNIEEKSRQIAEMQRLVRARETKQQQQLTDKQTQITRLQAQIHEHEHKLNEQETITRDFEDKVETRKRSYTVLESSYQSLHEEHMKLVKEKQTLQLEYNEIRREKEMLTNDHRVVTDNLREANALALKQMQDQHERNMKLSEENDRLEDRCRELTAFNSQLQNNLSSTKSELEQTRQSSYKDDSTRRTQLEQVIRQAEQIKAILSMPEASAVIDELVKVLAELSSQRDGLFTKITTLTKESENSVLRHKGQMLNLEKQNKLMQLKLQTVQKELEIRMGQSDTLRNLLQQRVRTTEDRTSSTSLVIKETFQIDTRDLDRVQLNYTEGLNKLKRLIKELEDIRVLERSH